MFFFGNHVAESVVMCILGATTLVSLIFSLNVFRPKEHPDLDYPDAFFMVFFIDCLTLILHTTRFEALC